MVAKDLEPAKVGPWRAKRKSVNASNWLNASIVGIQFPVAMAIGYFWGKWMDGLFGTRPWLTIIFFLFGLIAGFVNLFRITMATGREEERLCEGVRGFGWRPRDPLRPKSEFSLKRVVRLAWILVFWAQSQNL